MSKSILPKQDWPMWGAVVTAMALMGCGPTTFSDANPLVVFAPAPPKPEPEAPRRVQVTADRIEITEKIQFEFDKATIKSESYGLLNEIASVIKENPQIKKISIEGHTCSDGSDRHNQNLSERRAASVRQYLVEHGISEAQLTSQGFGKARPIASNDTDEGKERNRRVEFVITEQEKVVKTVEIDPKTGEQREVQGSKHIVSDAAQHEKEGL